MSSGKSGAAIVYGITNCDTVKKARAWLDAAGIGYVFHDYKRAGVPPGRLAAWCRDDGVERVLNRAGTTFRKLPEADKVSLAKGAVDVGVVIALLVAHPSMIRRPILELGATRLVGFDAKTWAKALNSA